MTVRRAVRAASSVSLTGWRASQRDGRREHELPRGCVRVVDDQIVFRSAGEPAFEFAGPSSFALTGPAAARRAGRSAAGERRPGCATCWGTTSATRHEGLVLGNASVNPDTIFIGFRCEQLVQERDLKAVGRESTRLELAQKFFDVVPSGDDHDDGLHGRIAMRKQFEAPDDVRDGVRRELLQLQSTIDCVSAASLWEMDDPQEYACSSGTTRR